MFYIQSTIMKSSVSTKWPHLVIVGGGFAGLELINALKSKPIRVTLIDRNNYHTFQPLLYQVASGGLGPDAIAYPYRKLIGPIPNFVFRMEEITGVNFDTREVITGREVFHYDYLCLANGAKTNYFGNADLEGACLPLKSIPDALELRNRILEEFEAVLNGRNEKQLNFVIVGGGPTGVETAGAIAEIRKHVLPSDYSELNPDDMQIHLVEGSPHLLSSMHKSSSEGALRFLQKMGVEVHLNQLVKGYDHSNGELILGDGTTIKTGTVVWSAGVMGNTIAGIPSDVIGKGNRILVDEFNRIKGCEHEFAVGDLALMKTDHSFPNGHPMVAPVAMQQAKLFAKNIWMLHAKKAMRPFRYFDKGTMATVGRNKAVFESFGIRTQGFIAWLGWMFLHLMMLVGYRNRLIVLVNWMWNYFTYQGAIRLIVRQNRSKRP